MALWKINDPDCNEDGAGMSSYSSVKALTIKKCKSAQEVRALAFNKQSKELAALSLNGYIHIWKAENFRQVS